MPVILHNLTFLVLQEYILVIPNEFQNDRYWFELFFIQIKQKA